MNETELKKYFFRIGQVKAMSDIINIYCDESCHLEAQEVTPENRFMVLGGISCAIDKKTEIFEDN